MASLLSRGPRLTKLARIAAKDLRVHPVAQRQLVPSKIRDINRDLDLDAIGTFQAVQYPIRGMDGTWIIDGQHRLVCLLDNDCGDWICDVMIHPGITSDAEASRLFLLLNNRATVRPFDTWEQECIAGDLIALGIKTTCAAHGITITRGTGEACATCVSALKRCYRFNNGQSLDFALAVLTSAYGKTPSALEGKLIEGMAIVHLRHGTNIDQPALTKKLSKYPGGASGLYGSGKGLQAVSRQSLATSMAEVITREYNRGRRIGQLGTT